MSEELKLNLSPLIDSNMRGQTVVTPLYVFGVSTTSICTQYCDRSHNTRERGRMEHSYRRLLLRLRWPQAASQAKTVVDGFTEFYTNSNIDGRGFAMFATVTGMMKQLLT